MWRARIWGRVCCFEEKIWEEVVRVVRSEGREGAGPVVGAVKDMLGDFLFCFYLVEAVVVVAMEVEIGLFAGRALGRIRGEVCLMVGAKVGRDWVR